MPKEFLDEKERDLGPRGYAGQFQQLPAAAKGAIINKGWLDNWWTPDTLPKMDYMISSWDMTFGARGTDADYVVGQVWGAHGDHRYLLDQLRAKLSTDEMVDAVRALLAKWPDVRHTIIEEAAAGKDVADTLERDVYGIERFKVKDKSKEQRLNATVLMWRDGLVHLPDYEKCSTLDRDYSWVRDHYVHELVTFPGSAHDDQVDATSQALLWMREHGPANITESVFTI
jgi:predicted phage terminase large subunit-like protein